jgi:hypothetical protein
MPVAAIIALAVAFWGGHGYTAAQPVTWTWDTPALEQEWNVQALDPGYSRQAWAPMMTDTDGTGQGQNMVVLVRGWWDSASNEERCAVIIHELGHASFNFMHEPAGIMAPIYSDRPTPGTCKRSVAGWRQLAGLPRLRRAHRTSLAGR